METAIVDLVTRALPLLLRYPDLRWDYDEGADVLYVTFESGAASDSELTVDDILLRYRDGKLIGVTVLHASTRVAAFSAK